MLRQLTRVGARSGVTGCRSMKTQGGQGDRGHVPTAFNHKAEVGRAVFTKQKVDYMSKAKKSSTLAYPEDAIINVESSTEATHRAVAGTNGELDGRTVRISEQTRNVMQSADKNANGWKIEFDTQERWENNTMGWGSTADPYSNTTSWLNFKTKEQAIQFAERQGWEIEYVQENRRKKLEFRNYGDNFAWNKRLRKPAK